MAALATTPISQAGTTVTLAAAAGGGDTVVPGPTTYLHVKNGGGSPITVTIDDPNSPSPTGATAFNPDTAVTVANGTEKLIGPITAGRFAQPSTGLANVTYSGVTSVTVAAFSI